MSTASILVTYRYTRIPFVALYIFADCVLVHISVCVCVCICGVRIFTVHLMITCFLYCLQEYTGPGGAEVEIEKPAKDEYAIAKWIKKNVPTKKTKFLNHHVEYFTGIIFNI